MQIPPSHHLLHALGSAPTPPEPVRSAAAAVAPEPVAPGRDAVPTSPEPDAARRPSAPPRPGARVDILV